MSSRGRERGREGGETALVSLDDDEKVFGTAQVELPPIPRPCVGAIPRYSGPSASLSLPPQEMEGLDLYGG